jgi:hypothetical protein
MSVIMECGTIKVKAFVIGDNHPALYGGYCLYRIKGEYPYSPKRS